MLELNTGYFSLERVESVQLLQRYYILNHKLSYSVIPVYIPAYHPWSGSQATYSGYSSTIQLHFYKSRVKYTE